jgi:SAM-dependent MidA family methyltransferase
MERAVWHDSRHVLVHARQHHHARHEELPSITAASEWFDALDQRVIGRGHASWVASVLGVYGDDQEWWIDVASAANPTANIVLRLSRRATVFHAVAALRRHRPRTEWSAPVIDVTRVC